MTHKLRDFLRIVDPDTVPKSGEKEMAFGGCPSVDAVRRNGSSRHRENK
jgi:hypothetical protein